MSKNESSSLFVMTAVGSLKDVTLRLANASKDMDYEVTKTTDKKSSENHIKRWENERFEIVSLVGTFSRDGSCHLHLSISDAHGNTFGGHLMEGVVFTTCEIVLGCIQGVDFPRVFDDRTGYKELLFPQGWSDEKTVRITQSNPLPMTVNAIFPDMDTND
jgi:predicted DNA-binding protein with PD1-like motif